MTTEYDVAVVGATGVVGETLIEILQERQFPVRKLVPLASERSEGSSIQFHQKTLTVKNIEGFDFSTVQYAFFCAGGEISKHYVPKAAEQGCVVIDNSSYFRNDPEIPLVVPEVNPDALENYREHNIIANPNCSTIQMVVALKPIYDAAGISHINVATYQSVSGAGKKAIEELAQQTAEILNGNEPTVETFPQQMAFNVIPQIDVFLENGYTKEEMKMVLETQKILGNPNITVNPTAVRVPVFYGHSEAVTVETERTISLDEIKNLLRVAPGIVLSEDDQDYPTAVVQGANQDAVFVGRVRQDLSRENAFNLWVVSDNVRKGAALNAVQIAECIINRNDYLN